MMRLESCDVAPGYGMLDPESTSVSTGTINGDSPFESVGLEVLLEPGISKSDRVMQFLGQASFPYTPPVRSWGFFHPSLGNSKRLMAKCSPG